MPDDTREWLEGFVDGLNFSQANAPELPHEYTVLDLEPEPFTVADILTAGRFVSSDQLWTVWLTLMRARERKDWPEIYADLIRDGFHAVASFDGMEMDDPTEVLGGYRISGSNAIVVSGKRSPTGAALLSGDPHLGFTAPNIWLLAGVKSSLLNVVGVMPTGLPIFALGRNPEIAWTGTSSYAQQSCTAGRASFITGQHPFRTGLLTIGMPGSSHGIPDWTPTIADLPKDEGYATAQFGKNHLGDQDNHLPTNHGFDEFYGNLYHLNAEKEPETFYYPQDPEFRERYGPRGKGAGDLLLPAGPGIP